MEKLNDAKEDRRLMKPMIHSQKALVVHCILIVCLFTGCAASTAGSPEAQTEAGKIGDKIKIEEKLPGIVVNETDKEAFEIVETPFGLVKRPKGYTAAMVRQSYTDESATDSGKQAPAGRAGDPSRAGKTVLKKDTTRKKAKGDRREPGDVFLNFDNADLYEVIRTFAELLEINYIIDKNVKGNVTIQTARGLHRKDLWPVFFQVLEINGLTAVEEDHLYRIVENKEASRLPLSYHIGRQAPETHPSERIAIQIVPLSYIKAAEMTKLIKPFVTVEGTLITHDKSNTLIIVDKGASIVKALKLIEVFDADIFQQVRHRFHTFKYNQAQDIAEILKEILDGYDSDMMEDLKLIPIERLNTLLVISSNEGVMDIIDGFIQQLDVPSEDVEPRIYIYHVQNGQAKDLGSLLEQIFSQTGERQQKIIRAESAAAERRTPDGQNPLLKGATRPEESESKPAAPSDQPPSASPGPPVAAGTGGGASTLRGELKITTDETRNALIIEAVPADYRIVEGILAQLDVMPRQVLIEVLIADISLDDNTDLGIEWSSLKDNLGLDTVVNIGSSGLFYNVNFTDRWALALNALATKNKLKIISAPSVIASDNKPASINISTEIPIASAEYEYNTAGGVSSTTIQYRSTGIILTVTPSINERGLVSMEISQEVSSSAGGVSVGGKEYPSFRQRSVKTTLTVGHQQTIVMGGLIEESQEDNESGVPFLRKIPFLKYLAGSHSDTSSRSELVLSITPHVIVSLEDVEAITRDFKKKISF